VTFVEAIRALGKETRHWLEDEEYAEFIDAGEGQEVSDALIASAEELETRGL